MAMAKRVWQLDSSRRIGLKITLTDFLIVGEVHYSRRTIAAEILSRFYCTSTIRVTMDKRRPRLDSVCQKGPEITLTSALIIVLS